MDYEERYELISSMMDIKSFPKDSKRDLEELLYVMSEYGVLDGLSIDYDLAIKIWNIVEYINENNLPEGMKL